MPHVVHRKHLYSFRQLGVALDEKSEAVEWLEQHEKGTRLLVCCRAGMGRSVSVVIAYLCCVAGLSYEDAVGFLKARRPGATPLPNLETTIRQIQELRTAGG